MRSLVSRSFHLGVEVVERLGAWMTFNAFLATVPVVLALLLFHRPLRRGALWWVGLVAFVLFLPNAPYVVTDLIHAEGLVDSFSGQSRLRALVPLALIGALVVYGLACYAICLVEVDRELTRIGRASWRVPVRAVIHLVCACGVVLGRVPRLHSWYVVTRPDAVVDGVGSVARPLAVPLVLGLAVAFALGAAAVSAIGRAAVERTREMARAGGRRVGWSVDPA